MKCYNFYKINIVSQIIYIAYPDINGAMLCIKPEICMLFHCFEAMLGKIH